jgi:hypothetical protein
VRLELRPSYPLAAAIVAAHGGAGLAVVFLMRDAYGIALGAALLALGIAAAWSRALLRGGDAARALDVSGGDVICELASGRRVSVTTARRRYVSRVLVTLPLGRRTLLVTADMLTASEFRRLRVWALWGKLPAVAGEQLAA